MKLNLEREKFSRSWQAVEHVAEIAGKDSKSDTSKIISGILIKAEQNGRVTLEATNLASSSVKCVAQGVEVQEPGQCLLPVAIAGNILKKSKSANFTLEVNDNNAILSSGRNKTRFAILPAEKFPNIPQSYSADFFCDLPAGDLIKITTESMSASSQPSDFPKYLGTCFYDTKGNNVNAVATDGKRIAISQAMCNSDADHNILLPAAALKDLVKTLGLYEPFTKVTIKYDGSTAWFLMGENDFETEFAIRRVESNFPGYDKILNNDIKASAIISCKDLLSAIERVDIIAKGNPNHVAAITLNPGDEMQIIARAPGLGTATEFVKADIQGEFMRVGFNVMFLQEGLKAFVQGSAQTIAQVDLRIEFSDPEGQTRIYRNNDNSFLYMVMPVRLAKQDYEDDESENNNGSENNSSENQNDQYENYDAPENNNFENNPENFNEYQN